MTKEDHIKYWLTTANEDLETLVYLFTGGKYTNALFFGHLHLEKICKALWVKNNEGNIPPFSHNLIKLLKGIDTGLSNDDLQLLDELNVYQLKGRYPDYAELLKSRTSKEVAEKLIQKIKSISACLQKKL